MDRLFNITVTACLKQHILRIFGHPQFDVTLFQFYQTIQAVEHHGKLIVLGIHKHNLAPLIPACVAGPKPGPVFTRQVPVVKLNVIHLTVIAKVTFSDDLLFQNLVQMRGSDLTE